MRDIEPLMKSGTDAVREVLLRPKNAVKGAFGDDIDDLFILARNEMEELEIELNRSDFDYARTMYEAADTCAYLFAIIDSCKRMIDEKAKRG